MDTDENGLLNWRSEPELLWACLWVAESFDGTWRHNLDMVVDKGWVARLKPRWLPAGALRIEVPLG